MKQNIYDDAGFFARYSDMPRSQGGLAQAGEWHELSSMLPSFNGKLVLDLGCGFGWHCRYAVEQGAASVVGIDLSERMLAHAADINSDPKIEYRLGAIEDIVFNQESFDIVISSLALHYVASLEAVFDKVFDVLKPGGAFVFSMEHPVFTALENQDWFYGEGGEILHWPLDNYQAEGERHSNWMADDVIKYHRTLSSIINGLVAAGFSIEKLSEPKPDPALIAERQDMVNENRRPIFLIVATRKP